MKARWTLSLPQTSRANPVQCCSTHQKKTWLIYMWHDSFTCDMTHSNVTWLIHMWHDSFTCNMTHSHVTCLIHVCLIHMWRDSFECDTTHLAGVGCKNVPWFIRMWHDSFCILLILLTAATYQKPYATHIYSTHTHTFIDTTCVTWATNLYAYVCLFYRALLQKKK